MTFVLYVSGHGFGHAVRSAELARALVARGVAVVLRSDAPAEAFRPLPAGARLVPARIDVGALQTSCLEIDEKATLDGFTEFAATLEERARTEARWLEGVRAALVVADIAPLGVLAARAAGLPAAVIANFTWDWIYEEWADRDARAGEAAAVCARAYEQARLGLRLPLSGPLPSLAPVEPLPLIVREAARGREEVRRSLGVGPGERLVLVAFGGFGPPDLGCPDARVLDGFRFVGYTHLGWPEPLYRRVERADFDHPDLVQAADVVLGKPGYGTVAECSRHGTRMLWVGRERFREVAVLVAGIRDHVGGCELPPAAMRAGDLRGPIEQALSTPRRLGPLPAGGAALAAERLLRLAREGMAS